MLRSPICAAVGHVDHGKSSILDNIRGTAIIKSEPGAITQAIGASIIPIEVIRKVAGDLLASLRMEFTIPGILFIDTPGHAAFTNLRRRGGNLADIAILVIDINEGFKPQTVEALEILKGYRTPFIVAANKIDLLAGWRLQSGLLMETIKKQPQSTQEKLDTKVYELVGKLSEYGIQSERFDRVSDYSKQVAIVPVSAKHGAGIPELLMVIAGLAQKFLNTCLECEVIGKAKGTILEVKEEKGIGRCMDAIIYNGTLKVNDTLVIGGVDGPITTRVKAMLEPDPLAEMRDRKSRFRSVKQVFAATGVRISCPDMDGVIAGMPIMATDKDHLEKTRDLIQEEVEEVMIETEHDGLVIKADSLGSLEALTYMLRERGIPIHKASVGAIGKKEIAEAKSQGEKNPLYNIILGFNVTTAEDVVAGHVTVLSSDIIYRLIEDYEHWTAEEKKRLEAAELERLVRPCKIEVMRGYVFRQSNPAVVGCDILAGVLKAGTPIMKAGRTISTVKSMQMEKESVSRIEAGKQLAVAFPNVTVDRQLHEGDILYSAVPEEDFRTMKRFKQYLSEAEIDTLKEIAAIMREDNPLWGV
ncbi:translation initiation factor IF-2 [Candidatus Woesearchaeota archaeon]|nr:translation initiation factor IF-2 [Candidatus Woesearchaeota archaeon]